MNTVKRIERLASALSKLDVRGADYKVAKSEFERLYGDKTSLKYLTGKNIDEVTWEDFRALSVEYQNDLGFNWIRTKGPFGPVELSSVDLPGIVGEELAEKFHSEGRKEGSFVKAIEDELPNLTEYLKNYSGSYSYTQAKHSFSSKTINNLRFKFSGRSYHFTVGIEKYTYQAEDSRKTEQILGDKALEEVKRALKLNFLYHAQEDRDLGKYQNVDYEGLKIHASYAGDEVHLYNFELKPTNSIEYISDAISQAVNYKEFANFTYIVIPLFDTQNFYDPDRYTNFVKLATDNDLGILSIDMNPNTHEILGVSEIAIAPKTEIENPRRLAELLNRAKREYCPLCRKVVTMDQSRDPCGWRLSLPGNLESEDAETCMKTLMERSVLPSAVLHANTPAVD